MRQVGPFLGDPSEILYDAAGQSCQSSRRDSYCKQAIEVAAQNALGPKLKFLLQWEYM